MTELVNTVRAFVTGAVRELISRRLWPVALGLIAAAIAIPVLLGKDGAAPAPPATAVGTEASAGGLTGTPFVTASEGGALDRRVLGARKDPFKASGDQSSTAASPDDGAPTDGSGADSTSGTSDENSSGGSTDGSGSSPSTDAPAKPTEPTDPTEPKNPVDAFDLYSLTVKVTEGTSETSTPEEEDDKGVELKRLAPLLSTDVPAIIYLGLLEDAKTAVFLLDEGVTADGDGSCHPSPDDCQQVYLHKGDTEFFSREGVAAVQDGDAAVPAVDFQLDIQDITTKKTASASKAHAARATASTAGRRALRSRTGRLGRLRYDRAAGILRKLTVKAYRSSMAHASRRRTGRASSASARASSRRASSWGGPSARATAHHAGFAAP